MPESINIFSKPFMSEKQIDIFSKYLEKSNNYYEFGSGGSIMLAIRKGVINIKSVESDKDFYEKIKKEIIDNWEETKKKSLNMYDENIKIKNKLEKILENKKEVFLGGRNLTEILRERHMKSYNQVNKEIKQLENFIKKINEDIKFNIDIQYIDINAKPNGWGYPSDETKKENWEKYSRSILNHDEIFDLILVDGRFRVACALCSLYKMDENSVLLFDDYVSRKYYHILQDFFYPIETVDNNMKVFKKRDDIDFDIVEKSITHYKHISK